MLAQAVLLGGAFAFVRTVSPSGGFVGDLVFPLIVVNPAMILFNLLPVGGLDGTQAWPLLPLLAKWARRRRLEQRRDRVESEIERLGAEEPERDADEPRVLH